MDTEIFRIFEWGPFIVSWYSLAAMAATALAVGLLLTGCRRKGLSVHTAEKTAVCSVVLGVFLGHFLFCSAKGRFILMEFGWTMWLTPWRGGMMFWGVVLGAVLAVFLTVPRKDRLRMMDCLAPALTLLIALMRFAEPLCGQGKGNDSTICFFPVSYIVNPRWPDEWSYAVFFWAGLYGLICLIALLRRFGTRKTGWTGLLGLILYCAGETVLESVRRDRVVTWTFVRVSQLTGVVILCLIVLYAIFTKKVTGRSIPRAVLSMAVLVGGCIALEFAVDKPLILSSEIKIYFAEWLVYLLLALCGTLMGLIAWSSINGRFGKKRTGSAA